MIDMRHARPFAPIVPHAHSFGCLIVALVLFIAPLPGFAQSWQFQRHDDGSFFHASISLPTGPGFVLGCGERSARGISPMITGNVEPETTPRDIFDLSFSQAGLGSAWGRAGPRTDVMVVAGATAYRFPDIHWSDYYGAYRTRIAANDAMLSALITAPRFEIRSAVGQIVVPASGFASAFASLTSYCRSRFAAIGKPWLSAPAAAPSAPVVSMRQAAEAAVARGCNGPSTFEPGAFLSGEIDGDGLPDVVLDWRRISCTGQRLNPFCGASMCSADVYLSSGFPRRNKPEMLLALGVRLQPLSNGNMAVGVGGSLSDCQSIGTTDCEFLFYWNGVDLTTLP